MLESSLLRFVPSAGQQLLHKKLLGEALTTDEEDQFGDSMTMLGSSNISISEKETSKKLFIRLAELNLVERPLSALLALAVRPQTFITMVFKVDQPKHMME